MHKNYVYLDNAATTAVDPEVAERIRECMVEDYGNPASAHHLGVSAENRVAAAEAALKRAIHDDDTGTVLWTSGGTESDAMGVLGAARAHKKRGNKVVFSAVEHSAVRECAWALAREGFEPVLVPVQKSGVVDPEEFAAACSGAAVAALMLVNNEIGTQQPVADVATLLRAAGNEVHLHCDAVQALGKIEVRALDLGVDSLAFAGHKIHGPKGVGALWLRKGARIDPLWVGGGQQQGLRSGTLNVPSIAGFGLAIERAAGGIGARTQEFSKYASTLRDAAEASAVTYLENGDGAPRAPHVLSLAFSSIPAGPLLHVLESRGVLVSAGSACGERDRKPSAVLSAISLGADFGTLRFSFGRFTTGDDLARAAEALESSLRSF